MRLPSLFAAVALFAASCSQYHYSPNLIRTPHFEKKGDAAISAAIGGGPYTLNADAHVAYSPIKRVTVMANYFYASSRFQDFNFFGGTSYLEKYKGHFVEAAVGGYMPIAFGQGAMYMGWGRGQIRNDYGISRIARLNLQRFLCNPL